MRSEILAKANKFKDKEVGTRFTKYNQRMYYVFYSFNIGNSPVANQEYQNFIFTIGQHNVLVINLLCVN